MRRLTRYAIEALCAFPLLLGGLWWALGHSDRAAYWIGVIIGVLFAVIMRLIKDVYGK